MRKIVSKLPFYMNFVGACGVCSLMFLTTADAISRRIFNSPIVGVYEMSGYLFSASVFLGLVYVGSVHGHIRIEMLGSRLSARGRRALELLGYLLSVVFLGVFTWVATVKAASSTAIREYEMGLMKMPMYPFRIIMAIGVLAFFAYSVYETCRWFRPSPKETGD